MLQVGTPHANQIKPASTSLPSSASGTMAPKTGPTPRGSVAMMLASSSSPSGSASSSSASANFRKAFEILGRRQPLEIQEALEINQLEILELEPEEEKPQEEEEEEEEEPH